MDKRLVFVTHTPLHLLYAINLINEYKTPNFLIFVINDYAAAAKVVQTLQSVMGNQHVYLLPGRYDYGGFAARNISSKKSRWRFLIAKAGTLVIQYLTKQVFKQRTKSYLIEELYIYDDQRLDTQSIMAHAFETNPDVKITLLEDGTSTYFSQEHWGFEEVKQRFNFLLKLIYTHRYTKVRRFGAHPLVTRGIILYPEYANIDLKSKQLTQMPPFNLTPEQLSSLKVGFGLEIDEFENRKTVLFLLPHSSVFQNFDNIRSFIIDRAREYQTQDIQVLAKYHPRDAGAFDDFLKIGSEGIMLVNRTIPAELICTILGKQMIALYSDFSSALLTMGWINPHIERFSLMVSTNDLDQGFLSNSRDLRRIFEACGVKTLQI